MSYTLHESFKSMQGDAIIQDRVSEQGFMCAGASPPSEGKLDVGASRRTLRAAYTTAAQNGATKAPNTEPASTPQVLPLLFQLCDSFQRQSYLLYFAIIPVDWH